jgi:small-conductance mechanosensitive channel
MTRRLPPWLQEWLGILAPVAQVLLIAVAAWVLQRLIRRMLHRLSERYSLPAEMTLGVRRISAGLLYAAALLLILQRLGVSGTVLWTAFTGFAAVAAVAFFAAWSVLSNIFCTVLILTTRPFRLHDHIELLEGGDKPGLRGRVVDVNLIYTTLQENGTEAANTVLQIPNSLFFQRTVRRWRSGVPQPLPAMEAKPADLP